LNAAPPKDADPIKPWFGPWEKITGIRIDESKLDPLTPKFMLLRNGDFKRLVYLPTAWRVLEVGEANVSDVPCCSGCGTAFVESGRYGILVCLGADCADRHDPASPPELPRTKPSPEEERHLRAVDEGRKLARDMITIDATEDIEEFLASQLGIHSSDMYDYISGRKKQVPA
jgi:hypothetical protein